MADKKITDLPVLPIGNIIPATDVIPVVNGGITKQVTLADAVIATFDALDPGVTSVNGRTGIVTLTSTDVGLANVNNTSDANKPVSTAQQTALNLKLNSSAVSAYGLTLVDDLTATAARTTLGASATGDALFIAATPSAARSTLAVGNLQHTNGFRLTLTSGLPVTPSDVIGASTVYACPYKGNEIALYDGTVWTVFASAQFSIALSGLTSSRPYDVFVFSNSGVPTLEVLAWITDTARATALIYQDGILVKSGAPTRRYLGTFYTTAATTTEDSDANRYLWNYYHRVPRKMKKQDATASWTYAVAAYRYANNNAANRLNFVIGVAEDSVSADLDARASATGAGPSQINSIGLNSNTAQAADATAPLVSVAAASAGTSVHSHYEGVPAAGFNYLAWLEFANGGTLSFTGSGQSFISGRILA